jgi:hypothetical protein
MFSEPHFQGRCSKFTVDAPYADLWNIGNDQAQSIVVPANMTAILWTDATFSGRSQTINGPASITSLGGAVCPDCIGLKVASSLQVRVDGRPQNPPPPSTGQPHPPGGLPPPGNCLDLPGLGLGFTGVYLFSDKHYQGACQRIGLGDPVWFTGNPNLWTIGNDAVQSFRFVAHNQAFRVRLYVDAMHSGRFNEAVGTDGFGIADMSAPPAGFSGVWIGAKTISSVSIEMEQLPVPTSALITDGTAYNAFVPVTISNN